MSMCGINGNRTQFSEIRDGSHTSTDMVGARIGQCYRWMLPLLLLLLSFDGQRAVVLGLQSTGRQFAHKYFLLHFFSAFYLFRRHIKLPQTPNFTVKYPLFHLLSFRCFFPFLPYRFPPFYSAALLSFFSHRVLFSCRFSSHRLLNHHTLCDWVIAVLRAFTRKLYSRYPI